MEAFVIVPFVAKKLVEVEFVAVRYPRLVCPLTPKDPRDAPPVTLNDVDVPTVKAREPSEEPPLTVRPVVVALPTSKLPPNRVFETVKYVVEALVIIDWVLKKFSAEKFVVEALVIVPLVANILVPVALVKLNSEIVAKLLQRVDTVP